jgi:predicted dehydrogenase
MEIKIGFIGCGGIANAHMNALSKIEGVKFVGMCDIEENKAKVASEKFGGKVYTDYKKMLDELEMDACFICLPPFAHEGQEELCIEKNIPFLVEKPIHLNKNKAKKIVEKIKEKNLITSVGYCLYKAIVFTKRTRIICWLVGWRNARCLLVEKKRIVRWSGS